MVRRSRQCLTDLRLKLGNLCRVFRKADRDESGPLPKVDVKDKKQTKASRKIFQQISVSPPYSPPATARSRFSKHLRVDSGFHVTRNPLTWSPTITDVPISSSCPTSPLGQTNNSDPSTASSSTASPFSTSSTESTHALMYSPTQTITHTKERRNYWWNNCRKIQGAMVRLCGHSKWKSVPVVDDGDSVVEHFAIDELHREHDPSIGRICPPDELLCILPTVAALSMIPGCVC